MKSSQKNYIKREKKKSFSVDRTLPTKRLKLVLIVIMILGGMLLLTRL